jgi:trigger factor
MEMTSKQLPKNSLELTFTLTTEDIRNDLERSARELTEKRPIEGFRPGKASYDIVKSRYGEMAIYEHALPAIIRRTYVRAVVDGKLRPFGEPEIKMTKLAPGNDVQFTATVTLVPSVVKLADYMHTTVARKQTKIEDKNVDDTVAQLSRMQIKENRVSRALTDKDKAVVDMRMSMQNVPVEGGQALNHSIYLNEEYFIPGLKEKIAGANEGEERAFTLQFPKDHFKKDLAGKDVDFRVTVKEIHELIHPTIDDAFAKTLGQESVEKLRALIRENLASEAKEKEEQRAENELVEKLVEKTKFDEVSDAIVNKEVERMLHELEHNVESQGGKFDDYLASIKKTMAELKLDLVPQAIKRIKSALLIRDIGEKEKIEADDTEVLAEQQKLLNTYKDNVDAQQQIRSEDYEDYLRTMIRNRKVMELLRKVGIKD